MEIENIKRSPAKNSGQFALGMSVQFNLILQLGVLILSSSRATKQNEKGKLNFKEVLAC